MQRNMDLIRLLLLEIEGGDQLSQGDLNGYTELQISEHYALLINSGFVNGKVLSGPEAPVLGVVYPRFFGPPGELVSIG